MVCQKCKTAHATVHLTSIDQCRKREFHFCDECARTSNLGFPVALKPPPAAEPPAEAWLDDSERARLMCLDCRHVNQENWNFCSACGSMRRPEGG